MTGERWRSSALLRSLAYVAVSALIVAVAVLAGLSLRERGVPAASSSPALSPTPAATSTASPEASPTGAATASATPSPTSGPLLDERFGFVLAYQGRGRIRSETSEAEVSSFHLETPSFSSPKVSPDGRMVAYWEPATKGAVLYVRSVTGGTPRSVLRGDPDEVAGPVAWSPDGTGLVVGLDSAGSRPEIHASRVSELWTIDLGSGRIEQITSRGDGYVWFPIAWDRAAKMVAAGVTGEGGYATGYALIDLGKKSETPCSPETPCPYEVRTTPVPQGYLIGGLQASSDARYVALATEGQDTLWWPLAQPERRSSIGRTDARAWFVRWRPGTSEIWWVGGLQPAGCQAGSCVGTELVSFDVGTGARTVRFRGTYGPYLQAFRVDGSAAITVNTRSSPIQDTITDVTVVDLDDGRVATMTMDGYLVATVRLR